MALDPLPAGSTLPPDDVTRGITVIRSHGDALVHLGVAGDTYTTLLSGAETKGEFCLIDMHVPPGGGPPPHRHDFEETFTLLQGELEATCRGERLTIKAGDTINIPANAPHQFHNASSAPVHMLCICSPAGNEELFREIGVQVPTRTSPSPEMSAAEQKTFRDKSAALAPKYRTELLEKA